MVCVAIAPRLVAAQAAHPPLPPASTLGADPALPEPKREWPIPRVNIARAIGWSDGQQPTAAAGLSVGAFACGLQQPRWLKRLPGGEVLVAETGSPGPEEDLGFSLRRWVMGKVQATAGRQPASADRLLLLKDTDGDGVADHREVFVANVKSPFGMALVGSTLVVAQSDGLVKVPVDLSGPRATGPAQRWVPLPAGLNHHWTKNVVASPDGRYLYATVGSNSNVGERGMVAEQGRAAIWRVDVDSGKSRLFATGLRNPNGMAFEPVTGALWTVVNERDEIGNDASPDYLTSVRDGDFFGWPWMYWGDKVDARAPARTAGVPAQARVPDYALGAHVAALGLAWGPSLTTPGQHGMFVGNHGSWNRDPRVGYDVWFVPFDASTGKPAGPPQVVLSGFLDAEERARGRPVGVEFAADGALLVADDAGNCIWRVARR